MNFSADQMNFVPIDKSCPIKAKFFYRKRMQEASPRRKNNIYCLSNNFHFDVLKEAIEEEEEEEEEAMGKAEDRISYLPDSVLQSIFTMMPLKSAIRTDVLSKKWRNLWKYSLSVATALDFGEDLAEHLSAKDFVESVNRYLSMNESNNLQRFHVLFCPFDLFAADIQSWISFAAGRRVRFLDIDLSQGFTNPADGELIDGRIPFQLPSSLFDCDSLIELSLGRCNFIAPLNLNSFGGLESLSISHSNINEEMLQSILTECPLLEILSLRNCQQLVLISIAAPDLKLKRLAIGDCLSAESVEIDAPKLRSFHYFGAICVDTTFSNISSLEDALINSIGRSYEFDCIDLLSAISHVQTLTLCKGTLMHLSMNSDYFDIELVNLHELQLLMTSMADEDFSCFYSFFSLPKHIGDSSDEIHWVRMVNPLDLAIDAFYHLKVIKLTNFKGSIDEMRLVSFFLLKAAILETLILVLPTVEEEGDDGEERLILRILRGRVSLLPKASPTAQIILHESEEDDGFSPTHLEIYNDYSCLPIIPCMVAV